MLQAEIVRPRALSPKDRAAWAEFRAATPAFRSPLLTPEFAEAVADARTDAAVAIFSRDGRTIGFLPHHRRPDGFARPIGATWSDYHALVAAPDATIDGPEALRAAGLSVFRFGALVDPHAVFATAETVRRETHLITLDGSGEDYWEALRSASPKRFKNLRRLEHKLEREVGAIAISAPDRDPGAFRLLFKWKRDQLRRTGAHDVLATPWSRTLMQNLFARCDGPLQGLLITLRVAGLPVAAHFGLCMGEDFHPWVAAYDPRMATYSPGMTFISEAIRAMPRLGLRRYDLSAGSDYYKRAFTLERSEIRAGELRLRGGGVADALLRMARASGPGPARMLNFVDGRIDHIAAAEPSLPGRIAGFAKAFVSVPRRLEAISGQDG